MLSFHPVHQKVIYHDAYCSFWHVYLLSPIILSFPLHAKDPLLYPSALSLPAQASKRHHHHRRQLFSSSLVSVFTAGSSFFSNFGKGIDKVDPESTMGGWGWVKGLKGLGAEKYGSFIGAGMSVVGMVLASILSSQTNDKELKLLTQINQTGK